MFKSIEDIIGTTRDKTFEHCQRRSSQWTKQLETTICMGMFLQKKLAMNLQLLEEGVIDLDGNVRGAKISYCTVWACSRGVVENLCKERSC